MDWRKLPVICSKKVILASGSRRRVELLKTAGIDFVQKILSVSEKTNFKRPSKIVKTLALRKALRAASKYPAFPVLAADTIVYFRGAILGKPSSVKDAEKMLRLQSGNWMSVYSAVALVWKERNFRKVYCDVARCRAVQLGRKEIKKLACKHNDKAGAYAVQDRNDPFIEKIRGRYDTVVGLPMNLVKKLLKEADRCTA